MLWGCNSGVYALRVKLVQIYTQTCKKIHHGTHLFNKPKLAHKMILTYLTYTAKRY